MLAAKVTFRSNTCLLKAHIVVYVLLFNHISKSKCRKEEIYN